VPDGVVNQLDYAFWKTRYGDTIGSGSSLADGAANVPEPAGMVLGAFAVIGQIFLASAVGRGYNQRRSPKRVV